MAIFDPFTLTWQGREYKIGARKIMPALARIEEIITLDELARFAERGGTPMVRLSMAYGSLLRYAGATVEDDEVFAAMFAGETASDVTTAVVGLLNLMLPPTARDEAPKDASLGNGGPAREAIVAPSSKNSTKPQSDKDG